MKPLISHRPRLSFVNFRTDYLQRDRANSILFHPVGGNVKLIFEQKYLDHAKYDVREALFVVRGGSLVGRDGAANGAIMICARFSMGGVPQGSAFL